MFSKDKKLKIYVPILFFLFLAAVSFVVYGSYLEIVNERLYTVFFEAYGSEFVNWYKELLAGSSGVTTIFGALVLFITPFVTALYISVVIKIVCAIFKSEMKFKSIYVMVLYTEMVTAAGTLLAMVMSVLLGSADNVFAFSIFMGYSPVSILYNFLSLVSVFSVIQYVLIYMIMKTHSELDDKKAIFATIIIIAVLLIVLAALAVFSAGDPAERLRPTYEMFMNMQ